jgi:hypothetical protein
LVIHMIHLQQSQQSSFMPGYKTTELRYTFETKTREHKLQTKQRETPWRDSNLWPWFWNLQYNNETDQWDPFGTPMNTFRGGAAFTRMGKFIVVTGQLGQMLCFF